MQVNIATTNVRNDEKRDPWRKYQCIIDLDREIPLNIADEMVRKTMIITYKVLHCHLSGVLP